VLENVSWSTVRLSMRETKVRNPNLIVFTTFYFCVAGRVIGLGFIDLLYAICSV